MKKRFAPDLPECERCGRPIERDIGDGLCRDCRREQAREDDRADARSDVFEWLDTELKKHGVSKEIRKAVWESGLKKFDLWEAAVEW